MNYRIMKKSGDKVSVLGFGLMRLPLLEGGTQNDIDKDLAFEMLDEAFSKGINYFDTAYPYHGGASESFLSDYLKSRGTDGKYIATKLPAWLIGSKEDMYKYLDEQMQKIGVDYIDYYLLHSLSSKTWENLKNNGVLEFIEDVKRLGKIRNIGFSFHDKYETFDEIARSYEWDFCQIQYNLIDDDYQAGIKGIMLAEELGMDVIVMEPLRGGALASGIPSDIQKKWDTLDEKSIPTNLLRYIWNRGEVGIVLSGMSTMDQVKENVKAACQENFNILSSQESSVMSEIRQIYKDRIQVDCTGCRYCMPCPNNVAIPNVFKIYNDAYVFGDNEKSKGDYRRFVSEESWASKCIECGECVPKCPQSINIIDKLKDVAKLFEQ